MPAEPITAAEIPVLQVVQGSLFLLLLCIVCIKDIREHKIPDGLQWGIASLTLLHFSLENLFGILGAVPYLVIAVFCRQKNGIGGGDVKMAGSVGLVLGLPASLTASMIGLTVFVIYGTLQMWYQKENTAFPVGPFLAVGAVTAYFMKLGGRIL